MYEMKGKVRMDVCDSILGVSAMRNIDQHICWTSSEDFVAFKFISGQRDFVRMIHQNVQCIQFIFSDFSARNVVQSWLDPNDGALCTHRNLMVRFCEEKK